MKRGWILALAAAVLFPAFSAVTATAEENAALSSSRTSHRSSGTSTIPPPAPKNPLMNPASAPASRQKPSFGFCVSGIKNHLSRGIVCRKRGGFIHPGKTNSRPETGRLFCKNLILWCTSYRRRRWCSCRHRPWHRTRRCSRRCAERSRPARHGRSCRSCRNT